MSWHHGKTAAEFRAEAQHLRQLARLVIDDRALAEIAKMIEELEQRARQVENGGS